MSCRSSSPSSIREAFERAERLKALHGAEDVFDFSIGNPTAACPDGVRSALELSARLEAPAHGYMDSAGYASVRKAIAEDLARRFGTPYNPEDIIMTTGAACALNIVMQSVLDPGDEVIAFLPSYPAYASFVRNWGAVLRCVPFDSKTLLPNLRKLGDFITERTKMVLVNSPNNPTGLVYPTQVAQSIADALTGARERYGTDILLVSDEPYRDLLYDDVQNPWWPALYRDTVVAYSFSKSASIAGERIGYAALTPGMAARSDLRRAMLRSLGDLGFVNAPATSQRMALACVGQPIDVSYYLHSRDVLFQALKDFGFSPVHPNGAFYLLLPAPDGDEPLLLKRLEAQRIVAVGGVDFGCPGYVRLSYCLAPEAVEASMPGFARVATSYFEMEGIAS